MPGMFTAITLREDQRIGFVHLFDGDGRDARQEGPIHRFDEFIGYDCVTGVGRMNAIQREQSSHEAGRQPLAAEGCLQEYTTYVLRGRRR